MTKKELVERICLSTGINTWDVMITIEALFSEIKLTLSAREHVNIHNFGSFQIKKETKIENKIINKNKSKNNAVEIIILKPALGFFLKNNAPI